MIPLPVDAISFAYKKEDDIEVYDENDQLLGVLCFCKALGDVDLSQITDAQYIAYINEVDKNSFGLPYRFQKDYIVLQKSRYIDYKEKYMKSAPLWGAFLHETEEVAIYQAYQFQPDRITAVPGINFPTDYHQESCIRSVVQPYAFERFLKLYHLLELIFDYDLVQQIKNLNINSNLQGIARLLSLYSSSKELNKINALLKSRHVQGKIDIDRIVICLNKIDRTPETLDKGKVIFFDYSKEGNPYQDSWTPLEDLMATNKFNRPNTNSNIKGITTNNYETIIIKIAAYWIYRVRSCIAHNRIGEYIMLPEDEEFIVEFAEPLLREVLYQVFTHSP
ncbi:MAG: hypothetical protein F6J96_03455 [Symploca sp. SIO1C2]|nr:hypothetical protein [Symploca sp. SIO1C2]